MINRCSPVPYTAPAANASPDVNGITTRWERLPQQDRDLLETSDALKDFLQKAIPYLLKSDDDSEGVAHYLMGRNDLLPRDLPRIEPRLLKSVAPIMDGLLCVNRFSLCCAQESPAKTIAKLTRLLELTNPIHHSMHHTEYPFQNKRSYPLELQLDPAKYANLSADGWKDEIHEFVAGGRELDSGEFVGKSTVEAWDGEASIRQLIVAAVSANRYVEVLELHAIPAMIQGAFADAHRKMPESVEKVLDEWSRCLDVADKNVLP